MLECGHISHVLKMHYFFKNLLFYSQAWIRQTKYDQGRVYQICKFHDPRGRGSDVRAWPYNSCSEYVLSSTLAHGVNGL